jgi:hypothetical protein
MENFALKSCTEYFGKALNSKAKSLQSSEINNFLQVYSKLLNHYDISLKLQVTALGLPCLYCGKYTPSSSLSSGNSLPCDKSHYFCSKDCIKRHSLISTNNTLLDLQFVCCPRCFSSIPVSLISDSFEGRLESIQSDACDRALKSLLDPSSLAELLSAKFDCEICLMSYKVEDGITLNCNHRYCLECLRQHISLLIDSAQVSDDQLKCPKCPEPITLYEVEEVASADLYKKYEKFKLRSLKLSELTEDEILFHCPGNDCEYFCIVEKGSEEFECPKCKHKCCPFCREPTHEGFSCEEFKEWKKENSEADKLFDQLLEEEGLLKCPECQAVVQRISGCQYMVCSSTECRGKTFFCYECGIKLKGDHAPHDCQPRWKNRKQQQVAGGIFNVPVVNRRAARTPARRRRNK